MTTTWLLTIKVVPGATQEGVSGWLGDRLKVRVRAPPEDGRANAAVEALLARVTGAASVQVISGLTSPLKTVRLEGGDPGALNR